MGAERPASAAKPDNENEVTAMHPAAMRCAEFIDSARLWQRHMRMAHHGGTRAGGVNRQALSEEEFAARRTLIDWGSSFGLTAAQDAAGNLFMRRAGTDNEAPPVLTGSHIDSQPTGGRFDGIYGVLAGLEVLQAMQEAGLRTRRPVELVAWMNEEGSRFAPGMMGSSVFGGARSLASIRSVTDASGRTVGAELDRLFLTFSSLPRVAIQRPVHSYIEAHIEQGPLLEAAGLGVGVVTGIQGKRTFRVAVQGEEAHAGTAGRECRRDALLAAVRVIRELEIACDDADDLAKFTVGRLDVRPNAPSVVPALVTFSVDLRHPTASELRRLGDMIEPLCRELAAPCTAAVEELSHAITIEFPSAIRQLITSAAHELGVPTMELISSAGHDARYLHAICPTGMIFVPCRQGISHNEAEWAAPEDLAAGARVLALTVAELAECER